MFRNGRRSRSVHVKRASHHPAALAWIRQCVFGVMSTALSRGIPPLGTHGSRRTQGIPS